jgi:antitoxin CptB
MSTSLQDPLLTPAQLSKLQWRCRRGLLENDLFIERFFKAHAETLTVSQAEGLADLMDLSDNDLLDLLLQRKAPQGHLAEEPALGVLNMLIKAGR